MNYKFVKVLTEEIIQKPVLISGEESSVFSGVEYLLIEQGDSIAPYEIRYGYSCSPFKDALIENDILAVGVQGCFYLFDLIKKETILNLEVEGYFGHLYFYEDLYYVADAYGLYCISNFGVILWHNSNLAIDGVIVEKFDANKIYGKGEHDPPNGWKDFILDLSTGGNVF